MARAGRLKTPAVMGLVTALFFASGCGDQEAVEKGGQTPPGTPEQRTESEYDPAMAGRVIEGGPPEDEGQTVTVTVEEPSVAEEPEVLTVDKSECRVFLPTEGWVGVARFWDIYYHEPHLLPGSFDHAPLRDIALEGFDGEPGPGLACIGVGDHRE